MEAIQALLLELKFISSVTFKDSTDNKNVSKYMNFKEKDLNPILFAIASKSLEGLKALVNKFGKLLRQSLKGTEEKYIFQIKEN